MERIEISAEHVWSILKNDQSKTPESIVRWCVTAEFDDEAMIVCEDMEIAVIMSVETSWVTNRIACVHPSHGTHKRFMMNLPPGQKRIMENAVFPGGHVSECKACDHGWYWLDSDEAKKQIVLAQQFGLFRGVQIGVDEQQNLHNSSADDMLSVFLSRDGQSVDSSDPPGRQPGRVSFFQDTETEQEK